LLAKISRAWVLCVVALTSTTLAESSTDSFEYYFKDYALHHLEDKDPLAKLIEERLAESIFDTTSELEFKNRIRAIQQLLEDRPERAQSLRRLNRLLEKNFQEKLSRAKQRRWLYSAAGAVVGALVALPISKSMSTHAQTLWIALPVGALAGGGLGFLLAHLIEMPKYEYTSALISSDFDHSLNEIEDLMK
jgi:hypothetical protein